MAVAYLETVYCTFADMADLISQEGVDLRLDDDDDGVVTGGSSDTATTGERLLQRKAVNWATSQVNDRCLGRYDAAGLSTSWTVNDWCTVLACWRVCRRRANPNPFQAEKERVDREMLELQNLQRHLGDIGMRESMAPGVDNFRIDARFMTKQQRVIGSLSDKTPVSGRKQSKDIIDSFIQDPNV